MLGLFKKIEEINKIIIANQLGTKLILRPV